MVESQLSPVIFVIDERASLLVYREYSLQPILQLATEKSTCCQNRSGEQATASLYNWPSLCPCVTLTCWCQLAPLSAYKNWQVVLVHSGALYIYLLMLRTLRLLAMKGRVRRRARTAGRTPVPALRMVTNITSWVVTSMIRALEWARMLIA